MVADAVRRRRPLCRRHMTGRWRAGDHVVLRAVGPFMVGKPAIVVEDRADRVMLYVPDGTRWFAPSTSAPPPEGRNGLIRALIEAWEAPFDAGLEEWRPAPAWPLPALPPGWDAHPTAIQSWVRMPAAGSGRGAG